jgi:hypothetical protein
MPRKPNNDPVVLLERANKQRERWSKAQTTYLERPENKEKHKEAVNSYYERNKEKLRKAANERNAKKREANKPATAATEIKAEPEMPKENVMEKAVTGLRTVEIETKKRNRNRKVAAQLQQVVADTNARNAERKREMTNRSEMAKEEKDASALPDLPINIVDDKPPVAVPSAKKVVRRKKVVAPVAEKIEPPKIETPIKNTPLYNFPAHLNFNSIKEVKEAHKLVLKAKKEAGQPYDDFRKKLEKRRREDITTYKDNGFTNPRLTKHLFAFGKSAILMLPEEKEELDKEIFYQYRDLMRLYKPIAERYNSALKVFVDDYVAKNGKKPYI